MNNSLDKSNFRQMIINSPDQFRVGFELAKNIKVPGNFKAIMISGMGGSALPGNLFRIYLNDLFKAERPHDQPLAGKFSRVSQFHLLIFWQHRRNHRFV
jgi:hypothetical protein